MRTFTDKRVPGLVIKHDGVSFHLYRDGAHLDTFERTGNPAQVAKAIFDLAVRSDDEMQSMAGAIGQTFGDMGIGVDIEDEPLTRPAPHQITSRIDQLMAEIQHEHDPARKAVLKKEVLRLMAMECTPSKIAHYLLS